MTDNLNVDAALVINALQQQVSELAMKLAVTTAALETLKQQQGAEAGEQVEG